MFLIVICIWLALSKASATINWSNIKDTQLNGLKSEPQTCANLPLVGISLIQPEFGFRDSFPVLCEQGYSEGGWTVIQQRFDGSVEFYRSWAEYENGFGDLRGEFWLGLKRINQLVTSRTHEMHILMQDVDGKTVVAKYSNFSIKGDMMDYMVDSLGEYSGDAGDSFKLVKDTSFSTRDKDRDKHSWMNCASTFKSGWWFNSCHQGNLNGLYRPGPSKDKGNMMSWEAFKGLENGLKSTRMMIRPIFKKL